MFVRRKRKKQRAATSGDAPTADAKPCSVADGTGSHRALDHQEDHRDDHVISVIDTDWLLKLDLPPD